MTFVTHHRRLANLEVAYKFSTLLNVRILVDVQVEKHIGFWSLSSVLTLPNPSLLSIMLFYFLDLLTLFLRLVQQSILPLALLDSTTLPLSFRLPYNRNPTLLPLLKLFNPLSQHLPGDLPILSPRSRSLYFEDHAGGYML